MRTQHSTEGSSSSKSLSDGGNQYQTKYNQFGKGYKPVEDDDMDRSSEDEDIDLPPTRRRYGNSPNGRQSPDISDDDSDEDRENDTESDTQSDDSDAGNDVKENDYKILEWIAEEVDENLSPEEREKDFRNQFAEYVIWIYRLRKQPVYKKVMKTVKELRDGPHDYDIEESVFKAVRDRKYLLNDVLRGIDENSKSDDDSDTGESSSDEEQNVSYRATKKKFGSVNS